MIKIALCLIVKGSEEEARLLDRCLTNVEEFVDGIFITATHKKGELPNKEVLGVCDDHVTNYSTFEWCKDFSKARNFNFAQVPKTFTHILWCDSDDVFRGLEKLRPILEHNQDIDTFSLNYLYHFNEFKQPDVVHMKTQIIKNDNCVEWVGKLHEDFRETRTLSQFFIKDIERLHLSEDDRIARAKKRNIEVSLGDVKDNPEDPRAYWNLGNSYMGDGQYPKALEVLEKFVILSGSDEEKYLTYINLSKIAESLNNRTKALDYGRQAIGIRPEYPDAYHSLGQLYYNQSNFKDAEKHILLGLTKKPPYYSIIVFNPRDYDFNPLMLLAKTYWQLARPDQAITCLEGCKKLQPDNPQVKEMIKLLKKDKALFDRALEWVEKLKNLTDKVALKTMLELVPDDLKSYPAICAIRNAHFMKTESSGKDIVYYCGMTDFEWNPRMAKTKGVGGSEEAVINLTKQWVKLGYNVTVYNNCGTKEEIHDGVHWKPFWMFNIRDKQDVVIIWRTPIPLNHDINASKILIDLHDVIPEGEFTEARLKKIDKIMVKTQFHRSLFPNIPDDKFVIIPNGIDFGLFDQEIEKNQYLMVNTSSPDRSMDVLPELFKRIKEQVPKVRLKWAYGWDIFDLSMTGDKEQEWKATIVKSMAEAGIENLGRLSQKECAKLYQEANILAYPSEFAEIDCISVKKAQAVGCKPVTTDFGALNESVQFGVKIHSKKTKNTWSRPNKMSYGLEDEVGKARFVKEAVKILKTPIGTREEMREWTTKFDWLNISSQWLEQL